MAAVNTVTSDFVANSAADNSKESPDPFKLQGYMKMFDDEKDGPAFLPYFISLYGKQEYETWKKTLSGPENFESVKSLFDLYEMKIRDRSELVNRIEVFFLLENVFRNVILRPYIPAHRSINMDCGRYHSFVIPIKSSVPFDKLNFSQSSPNLLTYFGTNQLETLMCAHTCAYLYHILKRELDGYDRKKAQSQQKQGTR